MSTVSSPRPILFTHFGAQWLRGSELVLLNLIDSLDRARFKPIIWTNVEPLAQQAREAGYSTHVSSFEPFFDVGSARFSLRGYVRFVREANWLVRHHEVALLHANSAAPAQWLAPVAWKTGCPLVVHLHAPYLRRSRFVFLLHQADCLVGVTDHVLEGIRTDGVKPDRLTVIHNGIDALQLDSLPSSDFRVSSAIPQNAILVGAVGSLIHRKGFDLLLRAVAKQKSNVWVCLIGEGDCRHVLEAMIIELGIGDRVRLLGYRSDPTPLYRAADMLVLPSRQEAFGLVLAEAGICGLPVIASHVGGIPELVIDGETGILVPPDDVDALACAIDSLANDAPRRYRMGSAARLRVQSKFSVTGMANGFNELYTKLIERPPTSTLSVAERVAPYRRLLSGSGQ